MENEGWLRRESSWRDYMSVATRGGQGEPKSCTPPGGAGGPQTAPMRLNDRPTDGQPHTSPGILGRKKCPEDLCGLLRPESPTTLSEPDHPLRLLRFRL